MAALQPHPTIPPLEDGKPVLVLINDGWGVNTEDQFNAVFSAATPVYDRLAGVKGRFRTVQVWGMIWRWRRGRRVGGLGATAAAVCGCVRSRRCG